MAHTYTKLKSGEWGVRVVGDAKRGQTVTVTTKAGKTKTERIDAVLWHGNGISLCSISRQTGRSRGARGNGRTTCKECGRPIQDAPHRRAMGGLCGDCAFDEYDM